nr:hypothetical protein CFP56_19589 [Quercus suber]
MPYQPPGQARNDIDDDDLTESEDGGAMVPITSTWRKEHHVHAKLPDNLKDVNRAGYGLLHKPPLSEDHLPENMEDLIDLSSDTDDTEDADSTPNNDPDISSSSSSSSAITRQHRLAESTPDPHLQPPILRLRLAKPPSTPNPLSPPLRTLTLHTLTNYDHVAARFYTDARIRHTGLPLLPNMCPIAYDDDDDNSNSERDLAFDVLHLTVRTLWCALATLELRITPQGYAHVVHWAPVLPFARAFRRFWQGCVLPSLEGYCVGGPRSSAEAATGPGRHAFTGWDVRTLTGVFRVAPDALGGL